MTSVVMAPDHRALRDHLRGGAFRAGVAAGRWRLVTTVEQGVDGETLVGWPYVIFAVSAAERPNSPAEFALRFELNGYPHVAPTGGIWDLDTDDSLAADRRPKGADVAQLFRTDGWQGAGTAMYAAWDRIGLQSHGDWAQKYPQYAWNPNRNLSFILEHLHNTLNADEYLGV